MEPIGSIVGEGRAPSWRRPAALLRWWYGRLRRGPRDPRPDLVFRPYPDILESTTLAPDFLDAPQELRQRVDRMAQAGALDEGSLHVFRPTVNAWVEQWCDHVQGTYNERLVQYRIGEAHAAAAVERLQLLADLAQRQLDEYDRRWEQWYPPPDPPAQPYRDPTAAERGRAGSRRPADCMEDQ